MQINQNILYIFMYKINKILLELITIFTKMKAELLQIRSSIKSKWKIQVLI
jgi:hypothetical protein